MSRRLLTPRWLGWHALILVLVAVMGALGWWQLDRAKAMGRPLQTADHPPVPLSELTAPRRSLPVNAIGRQVTATGLYDANHQMMVADRPLGSRSGFWLLTPLRLPDGAALPVVRGWVPDPADRATAVPPGQVTVTGRLQPSEPPGPPVPPAPDGQLATVTTAELVNLLPYPLYDGYLVATEQAPPPSVTPEAVPAPPPAAPSGRLALRNLAYAIQWWVFALFTVFVWWRLLHDPRRDTLTDRPPASSQHDRGVSA